MDKKDTPRRKKDATNRREKRKPSDEESPPSDEATQEEIDNRPLTDEERTALIEQFEGLGAITLDIEADHLFYRALMEYIRENNIPVSISIDKRAGQLTIASRPMGTMEFG